MGEAGYVRASGYNSVVSVERNGRRLIAAIFGSKSAAKIDSHAKTLLRRTFAMLTENDRLDAPQPKLANPKNTAPNRGSERITMAQIAPAGANKEDYLNDDSWSVQVGAYNRFARHTWPPGARRDWCLRSVALVSWSDQALRPKNEFIYPVCRN